MSHKEQEYNPFTELQEVITKAPKNIEEELDRTENSWLACFGSNVFSLEMHLYDPEVSEYLPLSVITSAKVRLEELKLKLLDLHKEYPSRSSLLSEELQGELMTELNVLRSEETS